MSKGQATIWRTILHKETKAPAETESGDTVESPSDSRDDILANGIQTSVDEGAHNLVV